MTIRNKLLAGFLAVVVILSIAGQLTLRRLDREMRATIGERSAALARSFLDQLESHLHGRIDLVRHIASTSLEIERAVRRSNLEMAELGSRREIDLFIDRQDELWRSAREDPASEAPEVLAQIEASEASRALERKMTFFERSWGYPTFGEIFVTNRYGANVAQTEMTSDYRQNDEPWWQGGERDGTWLSEVTYDDSAGAYSIEIAVRVEDEAGEQLGILKAVLDIGELARILDGYGAELEQDGGSLELWDRRGGQIYPQLLEPGAASPPPLDSGFWIEPASAAGDESLVAAASSNPHPLYPGLGWTLALRFPTARVFAPIEQLGRRLLVIALLAVLGAGIVAFFVSSSISRPISSAVAVADRLAEGDLTIDIEPQGTGEARQLLDSMRTMLINIRATVERLVQTARDVERIGGRLGTASREISIGAENQSLASDVSAMSVEQMKTSVEEMASTVETVSAGVLETSSSLEKMAASISQVAHTTVRLASGVEDNLTRLRQLAESIEQVAHNALAVGSASQAAVDEARGGGEVVDETSATMRQLAESIEEIVTVSENLARGGQKIHRMTEVIEDLSAQTNLLALNAAIQASHAGDAGRGFSVVAEEIKHLATRSAGSAKEINQVVEEVRKGAGEAQEMTRAGSQQARRGVEQAGKAGGTLRHIVETVNAVSERTVEIGRLTSEQAQVSDEVVHTFELMRRMTDELAGAARDQTGDSERIKAVVESLASISSQVTSAVSKHRADSQEVAEAIERIGTVSTQNVVTAAEIGEITELLLRHSRQLAELAATFRLERPDA